MLTLIEALHLVLLLGVAVVAGGVIGIRISSAQRARQQRALVNRAFYQVVPLDEYAASVQSRDGDLS